MNIKIKDHTFVVISEAYDINLRRYSIVNPQWWPMQKLRKVKYSEYSRIHFSSRSVKL